MMGGELVYKKRLELVEPDHILKVNFIDLKRLINNNLRKLDPPDTVSTLCQETSKEFLSKTPNPSLYL